MSFLIGIISIVIVIGVIGGGLYYYTVYKNGVMVTTSTSTSMLSGSDLTKMANDIAHRAASSSMDSIGVTPVVPSSGSVFGSFNGTCNWNGINTINQISSTGKVVQTLNYQGGKVVKITSSGTVVDVSAIMGVMCNTAAISGYVSYYTSSPDANSDGRWFTASAGGKSGQINIRKTTQNGQDVIIMENRSVSTTQANSIYISQLTVSAKSWLFLSGYGGFAPGTDLQLSKSAEDFVSSSSGTLGVRRLAGFTYQ